ncbi:MAG TPA: toll/interleukin-1 receptor domain-containing protein [Streptosporangiaceae bacterium]|nr:toll/interleukin-1 receptor domain-containing protein [Streptosporangiaceae bacterium]
MIEAAIYELGLLIDEPQAGSAPTTDPEVGGWGDSPQQFVDDDDGYRAWLSVHPAGFVINANRRPGHGYLVLHRAGCRTISRTSAGTRFTGDYAKICGTRPQLDEFARQVGGFAHPCGICLSEPGGRPVRDTSKYAPLRDYLAGAIGTELQMTFAQIEELVGVLPNSARLHRAWWSNSSATSRAWRNAGWRLGSVDQVAGKAIFRRDSEPAVDRTAGQGAVARTGDDQVSTAASAIRGANRTIPGRYQVTGHAFISYVREDALQVDRLQQILENAGILVWRDTANLWPGEDWRWKIQSAITDGALAFIACFSSNSRARSSNYQNAELILAIDQLTLRRPEHPWLIPVRFDDCQIPDRDIGGGRLLSSIQRADLFGDRYDHDSARLVEAILRILSAAYPDT